MARLSVWGLFRRLKTRVWAVKRIARALKLFLPMTRDVLKGDFRPIPWSAFGTMAPNVGLPGHAIRPDPRLFGAARSGR